jgi:hypothetical protein
MVFQAQSIYNTLIDRSLIDTYVDVARLLARGVPAPTLLVQQLEVSASTGSPNRNCHSKDYRSMVFQVQLLCNTLMDRVMIGQSVGVARLLSRGVPALTLVQQLEGFSINRFPKSKMSFQRLSLNGFSSPIVLQ